MANFFFLARWQRAAHPLAALGLLLATAGTAQAQTSTYTYTAPGSNQTYTVPAGVTAIRVVATGASGGTTGSFSNYSYGAQVQATVLVTPGEVLTVVVGGQGANGSSGAVAGGFNGGGTGRSQGGGGGATDLRRTGTSTGDYLTSRNALVVAGGGGGSNVGPGMGGGGNGGTPSGGNGEDASIAGSGGGGATQTGPGSAGIGNFSGPNGGSTATAGSNGTGGTGSSFTGSSGSGGGGGYYGGGGSYTMAGGGGGSSWVMPGSSSISYSLATATGNGLLTINPTTLPDLTVSTTTTIPAGSYNSITVSGPVIGTLAGNVTVTGAVVVQNGATLNDGCYVLSGPGSFMLGAGSTLGICSAQGISSSGATGSIQMTGTRSFSTDASYVYNGTAAQITGSGLPGTVRNLTTTNNSNVTLSQAAIVNQIVTVGSSGNLVLNNNALTLPSSASGTALIVNSGSGVVQGATGTMQRYIDASGNTGSSGYRHYSSPVSGATVSSFSTSAYGGSFTAQVNSLYNTQNPTTLPAATYPNVFFFDESKFYLSPAVTFTDFDKRYQSPQSLSDLLTVGRGYAVQIGNQEKVQFTGTFNTGTQTINGLYYTQLSTSTNTGTSAGWHLIGNPYPSPLDWGTVGASGTGSSISFGSPSIYVFQSTSAYSGRYTSFVNNVGAGTGLLAAGQAFFVRNGSPSSVGSITLTNANRVTTYGATPAFQRPAETRPLLRLSLGLGSQPATISTAQDETFVYFEQGATGGLDGQYDAYKLANPSGYYLSTASADAQPTGLSIDGRAPLAAGASATIPVWLSVPAGSYSLTATSLLNFTGFNGGTGVYLRDALTGTLTDLAATPSYSFSVAANAASTGRFSLIFGTATPLATTSATLRQAVASLYPNPTEASEVTLAVTGLPTDVRTLDATLTDALGRPVGHYTLPASQGAVRTSLPTQALASGLYLLQLAPRDAQGTSLGTLPTQRLSVR